MAAILAGVLPVFLLLALGYGLKKSDYLPDAAWRPIEKLAINVLYPGFLIPAIWNADLSGSAAGAAGAAAVTVSLIVSTLTLLSKPLLPLSGPAYTSVFQGMIRWNSFVFLPVVLAPLVVLTIGVGWFLAALGVYLRDVGQVTSILTMVMLFLAPVFYPVTALPADYRWVVNANPLTFIIEQARDVLIWGRMPDFAGLAVYLLVAILFACSGFFWFQKTRKGFADVL